jgi:hypothetical protein
MKLLTALIFVLLVPLSGFAQIWDQPVGRQGGSLELGVATDGATAITSAVGDALPQGYDVYGRAFVTAGTTNKAYVVIASDTSAYATGDCVGGWVTVADVARASLYSGRIRRVVITDKAAAGVNYDVVCTSNTAPTAGSCTDQAAFDPVDGELADMVVIPVTQHTAFADNGISSSGDINLPYKLTTTTMKCALVVRGAPTYASASDLRLNLYVDQD